MSESQPNEPTTKDEHPAALAALLRDADIACPACSYNLRGVSSSACPECGFGLRVTLDAGVAPHGWIAFLVLAFGWLLLASAMNTVRNASIVNGYATLPTHTPLGFGRTARGPDPASNGIATEPGLGAAPIDWPDWYVFVPGEVWFRLVWASGLLLAAIVGLVLTYRAARPQAGHKSKGRVRVERLSRFAMLAFAIYAGTHIYWFLEEMLY